MSSTQNFQPSFITAEYNPKTDNKEKDKLISQLKSQIFDYEQQDKNYDTLNHKFLQQTSEISSLKESKNTLEYELRQKDEKYIKIITDLRSENDNLQIGYNEKVSLNKKLYAQNDALTCEIEKKNKIIQEMTIKLNEYTDIIKKNQNDKLELEKILLGINNKKTEQITEISKLSDDNSKLTNICQEQERSIKLSEHERKQLTLQIEEANFNLKNLSAQLNSREENINYIQTQLNKAKDQNVALERTLLEYEQQFQLINAEMDKLKGIINIERKEREKKENREEQLERMIQERDIKINMLEGEIEKINGVFKIVKEDKKGSQMENEKLIKYIKVLSEQNDLLVAEIENVIAQDNKMREQYEIKDEIIELLRENKATIDQSLNNLNDSLNQRRLNQYTNSNKNSTSRIMNYSKINLTDSI